MNMMSTVTTTVKDSASAVGSAMGLQSSKKGIINNPTEFLGNQQNQHPVNYNPPPTSISSETYQQHTTSSSYSTTIQ